MPEIAGTKWGPDRLKTDGGVVTYSLVAGDVASFFGDGQTRSVDPEEFTSFGVRALFRQAFDAWSDVANIEFVEVKEQGEASAYGYASDIRITFGRIDGPGNTLANARLPIAIPLTSEGDILVDSGDPSLGRDRSKLLAVATHEIGHAIGLEHVDTEGVLMNPTFQRDVITPQADDILGARQIYSQQDGRQAPLRMTDRMPDLELAAPVDDLRIIGTADANRIGGARSDEQILGRAGDDVLLGRGGDDLIVAGSGADNVRGGGGEDTIRGGGGSDIIAGGGRSDMINGGGRGDSLRGGGGDDTILGKGGGDLIDGGGGDDVLTGGGGADKFRSSVGEDTITDFNLAADALDYSQNSAVVSIADLTLTDDERGLIVEDTNGRRFVLENISSDGFSEANLVFTPFELPPTPAPVGRSKQGGAQDDELIGTAGSDTLMGGGGDDTLFGYAGDDHLDGQAIATNFRQLSNKNLFEEGAVQQLFGGAGNDTLENALEFYGGDGDDLLITSSSFDLSVIGGRGDDTIVVVGVEHELIGGEGADEFRFQTEGPTRDINILDFEPGVDRLFFAAGEGANSRQDVSLRNVREGLSIDFGDGGFATLFGIKRVDFSFDDVIFEAEAISEATVETPTVDPLAPPPIEPIAEEGFALAGGIENDQIIGFDGNDTIEGREGNDLLEGGNGDDLIFGGKEGDQLLGGAGDDTLVGGPGNDIFDGGPGADVFVFTDTETSDFDFLGFFDHTEDVIDFSGHSQVNGLNDLALESLGFALTLSFNNGQIEFLPNVESITIEDITFIF